MENEIEVSERHIFRTVLRLALFLGLVYVAGRFVAQKKAEYADLTESQVRDKLVQTIGSRVGEDTASEIADQVIPKLKEKGLIKADPADMATEAAAEVADKAKEAADQVSEAVDSVVSD